MTTASTEFWQQSPAAVARLLLGKTIIVGGQEATVLSTEGFRRAENGDNGLYRPMLEMEPGSIYCPRRRNAVLLLLVTADREAWGGCVLVRAIESGGCIYHGPGAVTNFLEIKEHATQGTTSWSDESTLVVRPDGIPDTKRRPLRKTQAVVAGNGIGAETLARLMPKLTAAYMRLAPMETAFQQFLNGLLAECSDANELRRRIAL